MYLHNEFNNFLILLILLQDHPQNFHKRKALESNFLRSSPSPVCVPFCDSDIELDKAIKRAKLEQLHLQKILLKVYLFELIK